MSSQIIGVTACRLNKHFHVEHNNLVDIALCTITSKIEVYKLLISINNLFVLCSGNKLNML